MISRLARIEAGREGHEDSIRAGGNHDPRIRHLRRHPSRDPGQIQGAGTDELQASTFDFDLQVQLCTDLEAMPVNDTTVEWPEKLSRFVTVGRVHVPPQAISGTEHSEK